MYNVTQLSEVGTLVVADLRAEGDAVQMIVQCWFMERYHLRKHRQILCMCASVCVSVCVYMFCVLPVCVHVCIYPCLCVSVIEFNITLHDGRVVLEKEVV